MSSTTLYTTLDWGNTVFTRAASLFLFLTPPVLLFLPPYFSFSPSLFFLLCPSFPLPQSISHTNSHASQRATVCACVSVKRLSPAEAVKVARRSNTSCKWGSFFFRRRSPAIKVDTRSWKHRDPLTGSCTSASRVKEIAQTSNFKSFPHCHISHLRRTDWFFWLIGVMSHEQSMVLSVSSYSVWISVFQNVFNL